MERRRLITPCMCWAVVWTMHCIGFVDGFTFSDLPQIKFQRSSSTAYWAATGAPNIDNQNQAKVGDLLSDLPTPSLIVELSLMEKFLLDQDIPCSVDDFLADPTAFDHYIYGVDFTDCCGAFFIHTSVTSTARRDAVVQQQGSGKSLSVCHVDTCVNSVEPAGAYLGLGLANHHVGGYYWARSMGIGASLPAHGIYFGKTSEDSDNNNGELYWKKRGPGDAAETTEESSNSNDGKRSEWADFLKVSDTVQLVPYDPLSILAGAQQSSVESRFEVLLGLRRAGRPLGADPIVERVWKRFNDIDKDGTKWVPVD